MIYCCAVSIEVILPFLNQILLQSSIEEALDYSPYVILTGDINIDFFNLMNVQMRDCLSLYSLNTNVMLLQNQQELTNIHQL